MINLQSEVVIMTFLLFDEKYYELNDLHSSSGLDPFRASEQGIALRIRKLPAGRLSYTLVDLETAPREMLAGSLLYSPEGVTGLLKEHPYFQPLAGLQEKYSLTKPENRRLLLTMVFLFINPAPFSPELISGWLTEAGYPRANAGQPAMDLFNSRTEKVEDDCPFEQLFNQLPPRQGIDSGSPARLNQLDAFMAGHDFGNYSLVYDEFTFFKSAEKNREKHSLLLDQLSETGFIVMDHNHLVLGLSATLLELSAIAEVTLPETNNLIRRCFTFHERSLFSLGSLIQHAEAEFIKCITYDVSAASIVVYSGKGMFISFPLAEFLQYNNIEKPINSGIPVYLILNR